MGAFSVRLNEAKKRAISWGYGEPGVAKATKRRLKFECIASRLAGSCREAGRPGQCLKSIAGNEYQNLKLRSVAGPMEPHFTIKMRHKP